MAVFLTSPIYDPTLFVNRETELSSVDAALGKLVSGDTIERRTIQVEGLRGGGKSWLAFHLQRKKFAQRMDVKTLLFAFDLYNNQSKQVDEWHYSAYTAEKGANLNSEEFAESILRFACQQLAATDVNNASLEERITWLVRRIRRSGPDSAFVFILDSVSELNPSLLEILEQSFLASVAELSNVLIILTGRPPQPLWTSVNLRVKVEYIPLQPLSKPMLTEALKSRATGEGSEIEIEGIAEKAYDASKGNPGAFMRLAAAAPDTTPNELDQILDELLNVHSIQERRDKARRAVEALCILTTGFRQEEITVMLTAYAAATGETVVDDIRTARDTLQDERILSWDFGKQGFALDGTIRRMAEDYLRAGRPEIWTKLHETAAQMYEEFAVNSPKWKAEYLKIAQRHRHALGILPDDSVSAVHGHSAITAV